MDLDEPASPFTSSAKVLVSSESSARSRRGSAHSGASTSSGEAQLSPPSPSPSPPALPPPALPPPELTAPTAPTAPTATTAPTPTQPPHPTLDATSYPTLISLIFQHADRSALLHLRSASRAFRLLADKECLRSIIISPRRTITTSRGRLPWQWDLTTAELFPSSSLPSPFFLSEHHRTALSTLPDEITIFADDTYWSPRPSWPSFSPPSPIARRRLVLTFHFQAASCRHYTLWCGTPALDIATLSPEVVVVFALHPPPWPVSLSRSLKEYRARVGRLGEWITTNPRTEFTFVNAQSALCAHHPCHGCMHLQRFQVDLWDAVYRHADGDEGRQMAVERAVKACTWESMEEYRDLVGEVFEAQTRCHGRQARPCSLACVDAWRS